jgi:hypothetical protein
MLMHLELFTSRFSSETAILTALLVFFFFCPLLLLVSNHQESSSLKARCYIPGTDILYPSPNFQMTCFPS